VAKAVRVHAPTFGIKIEGNVGAIEGRQ
jgi:hypothetical protein